MLTGGDQLRLTSILGGTELLMIMKQRFNKKPIVIAGTSAWAAAMSTGTIYEEQKVNGMLKGDANVATWLLFFQKKFQKLLNWSKTLK